jgi:hypothetical protein
MALTFGQPGFFAPRPPQDWFSSDNRSAINSTENAVATSPARRWEVPIARHHFVIIESGFLCVIH